MSIRFGMSARGAALAAALLMQSAVMADGKIVVCMDEFPLSDIGYSSAPTAGVFAANLGEFFSGDGAGNFLVYSANFGVTGSNLAATMTGEGHTWTISVAGPFTVDALSAYDAVFLAARVGATFPDNQVLIDYVEAGGDVYLCAGTGGGAAAEAAGWNTFLNHFGLEFAPTYVLGVTYAFAVAEPPLVSVESLFFNGGNPVLDTDLDDTRGRVILTHTPTGAGLIGVYSECPGDDDGDGDVDFDDLNRVLSNFGATSSGVGDADGDGDVDFNDLNLVLSLFGTEC